MTPEPQIIQPEKTESTNTHLKELLKQNSLPEGSVVITHNQISGRGQPGNKWESQPGKNLTFSIVLYPDKITASKQFIISKTIAVGIISALEQKIAPIEIKWPNDLYYDNKKLGGILIENSLQGNKIAKCIVGIGININQVNFSENLPNPVSIKKITGKHYNLTSIFEILYQSIMEHYFQLIEEDNSTQIENAFITHLFRRTGMHKYRDAQGVFMAQFYKIGSAGHLYLRRENGDISRYAFKEVEFIR